MNKVVSAVQNLYNECGITDPLELPIETIISSKNILIKEEQIDGAEGRIIMKEHFGIITINSSIDFYPKKRFILAHELGHFELHRHFKKGFSDNDETLNHSSQPYFSQEEIEANEFAAEFLMPSELFAKECKGKVFSHKVIEYLADKFQVSKTATILKFVKNGNHPVFVVCCQGNKMKWFNKSDDWRYYSQFSKGLSPPSGSVACEVFQKGFSDYREKESQQIWKSDWFIMRDDEVDSKFYEYCLFVPYLNYMISVIWEK